jgi:ribosomal protein S18 acetylase RimI-like enzyme
MVSDEITIREATIQDIPDLVRLRRMMFESMGFDNSAQMNTADAAANAYLAQAMPAEEFYGWLAVTPTGEAVGSGGVVFDQHPPGPTNVSGRTGYIMNLVTDPRYRRRGIARHMMQTMIEWLAKQGVQRVTLHATDVGRSLYEELGFVDSNEMSLRLELEHI